MTQFYPLTVTDIRPETRDAVVVDLMPEPDCGNAFDFLPGQYLTFRRDFDGEELRRSYSICASPEEGVLRVGIKRVDGGCFSSWANETLSIGDRIDAMPPMGNFTGTAEPKAANHYLMFAVGSGITPVISIIRTKLQEEPDATVTLIYGNRSVNTIMFREALEDLKNRHLNRFAVIHMLTSEADLDLFSGRVDARKCEALFRGWIDVESIDQAFICGPESMMLAVSESLVGHGLARERIKFELFTTDQAGRARRKRQSAVDAPAAQKCKASIIMDGSAHPIEMAHSGQSVLEAGVVAGLNPPHSCKAGVCSTCRAHLREGEVEMMTNYALEDYEVRRGFILTCQSYPLTDKIVVDYDL